MRLPRRRPAGRPIPERRARSKALRRPSVVRRRLGPLVPVPPADPAPPKRRASLTGRAALLAIAVCAVVLSLAYPLREFFAQRGEINSLRAENAAAQLRVGALEVQDRRWQDPTYVRTQARKRLHYLMPGETAFVVIRPAKPAQRRLTASVARPRGGSSWYDRLWTSVEESGRRSSSPR